MQRLTRSSEFQACYRKGRMAKGRLVVVYARRNNLDISRVGFSVSKKLGKAVQRNKVKRRLREIVRLASDRVQPGMDLVVAARVAAVKADYKVLEENVYDGFKQLGILDRQKSDEE